MKTTIILKKADLVTQALLLTFVVLSFNDIIGNGALIYVLFGWQLFSATMHTVFRSAYYASQHRKYAFIILIIALNILCAALILIHPGLFQLAVYGILLLIHYYMFACYAEIRILDRKAVVHLRK